MTREEHWKIVDAVIDAHNDNEMGGKYAKAFNHGVQSAFNRVCKALKDIEQQQQPNRCDSCTHSEEQDGSNCYECVKGMADNFEAQPTNMRDATEEERKSVKDYVESISKPTGVQFEAQPSEDCISREAVIKNIKWWFDKIELNPDILIDSIITLPSRSTSQDCISRQAVLDVINFEDKWLFDAKSHNADTKIAFSTIKSKISKMPYVTPERPKGKWIYGEDNLGGTGRDGWYCNQCGHFRFWDYSSDMKSARRNLPNFCPNCGADMSGGEENEETNN